MSQREILCFLRKSEFHFLEPGLHPSFRDILGTTNTLIQKRHNFNESSFIVKMSQKTQIFEIYLAKEKSGLAFIKTDYGHLFGSGVSNEFGVMVRGRRPHKREFAHDIARIHSSVI